MKPIKKSQNAFLSTMLSFVLASMAFAADDRGSKSDYDPGPDTTTDVGYRYAELIASTPNYRAIGRTALGNGSSEKFRWEFGPMFYRGRLGENQVQVLVIDQEGAEDENVSDRSFTGGTGGRMQNVMDYLGLNRSYLFLNTFVYTIKGQYADYAPYLYKGKVKWGEILTEEMFKLAQTPESPVVDHRQALLDHVLASNADSLKLVIAVGGAAQDTLATYIASKGGECDPTVTNPRDAQMIEYGSVHTEKNRAFFFPVDSRGNNLLLEPGENPRSIDYADEEIQKAHRKRASEPRVMDNLVKKTNGRYENGVHDLRQLGTDLYSCRVNGREHSLKGIQVSTKDREGSALSRVVGDVRFIQVKHPGSNSPTLEGNFRAALDLVKGWASDGSGWGIEADSGMRQNWTTAFRYGHHAVPHADFRFGLPDLIGAGTTTSNRTEKGSAIQIGGNPTTRVTYDRVELASVLDRDTYVPEKDYQTKDLPNEPNKTEFSTFDVGPGKRWAEIFTGEANGMPKLSWSQPSTQGLADKQFGANVFYRGRPDSTEVLVLADQTSHDDLWVGRALMGYEGQKLQSFLQGIGAGLNYTILRTLPMDTLGASDEDVRALLRDTSAWREAVWQKLLNNEANTEQPKLILTLGEWAETEISNLPTNGLPVIRLTNRYKDAYSDVAALRNWNKARELRDWAVPIAREDIPYGMRRWTGTSGDRVIRASGTQSGKYFLIVAPNWATSQKPKDLSSDEKEALQGLGLL